MHTMRVNYFWRQMIAMKAFAHANTLHYSSAFGGLMDIRRTLGK
jgi:hypothetical protein